VVQDYLERWSTPNWKLLKDMGPMGKFATTFGIGALGGGALQALEAAGLDTNNPNEMPGDVESLKSYLKQGYLQLNPDKTFTRR
jgi:hypothetical protein